MTLLATGILVAWISLQYSDILYTRFVEQAATAIDLGAILITANTRDFPMEDIQLLEHR